MSSQLNSSSPDKLKQRELAVRRAEYIRKLRIQVVLSDRKLEEDRLISIKTYNTETNMPVELVMRRLTELDSLVAHMNSQYGGHVIPTLNYELYFQDSIRMDELVPDIQEYLNDLKHNKYCRQDIKFYCFMIEQHTEFAGELGLGRIINNATDKSRKFLNDIFTRKTMPSLKDTNVMVVAHRELATKIQQYNQIKELSLIKSKEPLLFEEVSQTLAELSAWPGIAIEPQQLDIQFIFRTIKSCEKLIKQSGEAYLRWEKLVDVVLELQSNVFKGLHEYGTQFNDRNEQLRGWSDSLSREFHELTDYLSDKMEALCGEIYKINKRLIDMTVFAGQCIQIQEPPAATISQPVPPEQGSLRLKTMDSFELKEKIEISESSSGPQLDDHIEVEEAGQKMEGGSIVGPKEEITCDDD